MLSFILATVVITLVPGPTMLLIILNSIQGNLIQGILTGFGAVLADAILLFVTITGVGALVLASPLALTILKIIGAAYLIYLGAKQLWLKPSGHAEGKKKIQNAFVEGLGITLINPKIIGFFIAFFPQFIDSSKEVLPQLKVLAPLFLAVVLLLFISFAVFARGISPLMKSHRGQATLQYVCGITFIACGLYTAVLESL